MSYTEDQIKNYLEILHNYTSKPIEESNLKTQFSAKCSNCENRESFTIDYGYKICEECGVANGHVLCFYDNKDFDRLHYLAYINVSITMKKRLIKFLKE